MNAWKPPRVVLQRANPHQMIDALLHRLDVPVEHRDVGAHAEPMRGAMDGEIAIAVALVVADLPAHARARRSRRRRPAASRGRPRASSIEHPLVAQPVEIGKERDLDGGEALQVNVGTNRLQAAQQILVVVERQLGMQAVDDVDFGERLVGALAELVEHLLDAHRVRAGIVRAQPRERAEQARRLADVGRLEPQVVIEVGARAVPTLALAIGQPARAPSRSGVVEQPHAIVERQPLAGAVELFVGDVLASSRVRLEACGRHSVQDTTPFHIRLRILSRHNRRNPGQSGKLGVKPTRFRHCKRGARVLSRSSPDDPSRCSAIACARHCRTAMGRRERACRSASQETSCHRDVLFRSARQRRGGPMPALRSFTSRAHSVAFRTFTSGVLLVPARWLLLARVGPSLAHRRASTDASSIRKARPSPARPSWRSAPRARRVSARTDDDGTLHVRRLADGRYDLTVSAPGLVGEARGVAVDAAAGRPLEITLRVSAITETLRRVRVADRSAAVAHRRQRHGHQRATSSSRARSRRLARRCAPCPASPSRAAADRAR